MTVKRERVAAQVRARIERGDYADGQPLIQARLAAEFGVHREVVRYALAALRREGWVAFVGSRYLVNATHASRQLQRLLSLAERLDLMEKKLDAMCRYLLPSTGRYVPPGVTYPWQKQ